jgi:hypothetical protein
MKCELGVRDAIREIVACEPPADEETALFHDLRIAGDDAWELMDLQRKMDRLRVPKILTFVPKMG